MVESGEEYLNVTGARETYKNIFRRSFPDLTEEQVVKVVGLTSEFVRIAYNAAILDMQKFHRAVQSALNAPSSQE